MSDISSTKGTDDDHMRNAIAVSDLVARMGHELESLCQLSLRVQGALSQIDLKDHCPAESIRDLQGIDRISQVLGDLAGLAVTLSKTVPDTLQAEEADIFAPLKLSELVQSLDPHSPIVRRAQGEEGDIQWF